MPDQVVTQTFGVENSPITLLLVEDDVVHRTAVRKSLNKVCPEIIIFESGTLRGALEALVVREFDVIFLDLSLPDSQSLETFERVFQRAEGIPIIVVSGDDDKTVAVDALRMGAQDFIVKSTLDGDRLFRCIKYALARCRNEQLRVQLNSFIKNEWQFREAFQNAPIGIFLAEADTKIVRANEAFCRLVDYSEAQLIGKTSLSMTHDEDIPDSIEKIQELVDTRCLIHAIEQRYVTRSGSSVWCRVSARLLAGDQSTNNMFLFMVENISEDRRAKLFLRTQLEVAKAVSTAPSLADLSQPVLTALVESLECSYGELWSVDPRSGVSRLGAYGNHGRYLEEMSVVSQIPGSSGELGFSKICQRQNVLWLERLTPEWLPMHAAPSAQCGFNKAVLSPILSGSTNFGVLLLFSKTPLTADAKASATLSFVCSLIGQYMHRKRAEEEARRALLVEQREEFISTLAHDLKTPISGANRMFDLLAAEILGPLTQQQIDVILKLKQSGEAQLRMIQNLLQMYKLESGTNLLSITQLSLNEVIGACIEGVKPLADAQQISITVQSEFIGEVMADYFAISRLIQNLLDNALKYTEGSGSIFVRLWAEERDVFVSIKDSGKGIPPELRNRLFQRFSQGSTRSTVGGSGIGLYLCKQIVEAHGGSIWIDSEPNEGSTFTISLPNSIVVENAQSETSVSL